MEQRASTFVFRWIFGIAALLLVSLMGCEKKIPEPESTAGSRESADDSTKAEDGNRKKEKTLVELLRQPTAVWTHRDFELIESADKKDRPAISEAFAVKITCDRLKGLVAYLMEGVREEVEQFDAIDRRVKIYGRLSEEDKREDKRITKKANAKIKARAGLIDWLADGDKAKAAIRKNAECLAKDARAQFDSKSMRGRLHASLMASILKVIGEPGFAAFLKAGVSGEPEPAFVVMEIERFGGQTVFPLLKWFEKEERRDVRDHFVAFIYELPDTNAVYQRVIDAINHGRFYPKPASKPNAQGKVIVTLEEGIRDAESWWGNHLKMRYRGHARFARYASKHMPWKPGAQLASLFIEADAGIALEYFLHVKPGRLSDSAFLEVRSSLLGERRVPVQDRQRFFGRLFKAFPAKRMDLLLTLEKFPSEFQRTFILANFEGMAPEERKTALFRVKRLPDYMRTSVLIALRPKCNEAERAIIDISFKGKSLDI